MPYTINKYNGQVIATIADGTIDSTTDLKLIGKNYAGYGEVQNENFLFLLENFANNNPPPRPMGGQLWFDSGNSKLKFYDGAKFRTTGGAEVNTTAPTGLTIGDFWWDTNNKQLRVWDGASYVLVGPEGVAGSQTTQMRSRNVRDTLGSNHAIIESIVNGATIFVVSADAAFTLDSSTNDITGFTTIRQGITLAYTNNDNQPGQTTANHRFWGTATNADRLGGFLASDYVKTGTATFADVVRFGDAGFEVGNKLKVFNSASGAETFSVIQNPSSDIIKFQVIDTTAGGAIRTPLTIVGNNILPGSDAGSSSPTNLGSGLLRFNTVHARTFNGIATRADSLFMGQDDYRQASSAATSGTVAVRTSSPETINNINITAGSLKAAFFVGTATSANYADLAEKYLADKDYPVGTVVSVGGEKEVTASKWGDRALGVVSGNPAYMMNAELEGGTFIALKGRVPVFVSGAVKKGDRMIASNDGTATAAVPHANDVFAIALESNSDTGVKIVECVVL